MARSLVEPWPLSILGSLIYMLPYKACIAHSLCIRAYYKEHSRFLWASTIERLEAGPEGHTAQAAYWISTAQGRYHSLL